MAGPNAADISGVSSELPVTIAHDAAWVPSPRGGSLLGTAGQLAGFEVVAELGRGARSTVYRVRRTATEGALRESGAHRDPTEYALKILDHSLAESAQALIAFRREAALLAGVNHPGLTRVHEVGTAEGRPYLVMDLVTGKSLAEALRTGPMPPEQVITLALDIVDPLAAVHRKGLIHRDLKPPNIMVLASGEARLIDFGLTAREGEGEPLSAVGTLAYCSPEQSGVLKRPVDNRSDLYSLGVVLFECLAGVLPFPNADVGELLRMHAVTPAPDLCELVPGTPRALSDVVATLLAKDPDDRYQNGEDLAADLRALTDVGSSMPMLRGPGPFPSRTLSGRENEVAVLASRWERARRGQGGVCVIRGGSGAGKSRLAAELSQNVQAAGGLVVRSKSSLDDPVPFGPLRAGIEDHLRELDRLPTGDRERGHARIRAACGQGVASMLSGLTPGLAAVLTAPTGPTGSEGQTRADPTDAVTGADDQDQFAFAFASLLIGLARECGSLLMLVDDVQWLDRGSQRVLTLMSFELGTAAALVIVTARNDAPSTAAVEAVVAELGAAVDVDLVLTPLDEAGVADQIETIMPGLSANARVVTLLRARSNGSPFVVQEYLRAVVDAGLLRPSWGTWILDEAGLDALALPNDALGLVITRVAGLGPRVRDLLIVAASIGSRFQPAVVATVADHELDEVLSGLTEAAGHGLVEPRDGGQFAFLHDRIREALLEDLYPAERSAIHARIAAALEAMPIPVGGRRAEHVYAIAHHHMLTSPPPNDDASVQPADVGRALIACRAAGRLALDNHAPVEAVAFLEHAARLGDPRDSNFLLLLGTALMKTGRLLEARTHLDQALDAATDPLARAEILTLIADVYRSVWDLTAAHEAVEKGLIELQSRLPRSPLALIVSTLSLFAAAVLMRWTGIRFGSATGSRARRGRARVGLHDVGAHVCVLDNRLGTMMAHNLRLLYRASQLGPGPEYALGHARFGIACSVGGLPGTAARAFARAQADPADAIASVRALTAWSRSMGRYLGGQDNGQELSQNIEAQGQWLDHGSYLDSVGMLNAEAAVQGQTAAAEHWLDLGRRRLGGVGDVMLFTTSIALTHAVLGRHKQAGTELQRMTGLFAGHTESALALARLLATFVVLGEQGEFGASFDDAVTEFEALNLSPAQLVRPYRVIHFKIAEGRLGQLRVADAAQRPIRLAAARQAVRLVVKGATIDILQARGHLVSADLLVLENEPGQALQALDRMPAFLVPDAPRLFFEAARIRARALIALGAAEAAERHAESAAAIAQAQGWPHHLRAITVEFGVSPAEHSSSSRSSLHSTHTNEVDRQRLHALQQVSAAASQVLDPGALARIALDETIRILAADRAFLFLTEGPDEELRPHLGRDADGQDVPELTGYSSSLVERVRESRTPLVVTGTEEGAALGAESVVLHGLRSIMVAPLELEGRLLGVVYLDSQVAKGIFTADDVGILTALTNHIATSLETIRAAQLEISVETARQQRDLADMLRQTLQSMSETLDPVEVTQRLLNAVISVVPCDGAWVLSADGPEDGCVVIANDGPDGDLARHPVPDESRLRALITRQQPWIGSPEGIPLALTEQLANATSWITLPVQAHGQKSGVLVLASTSPDADLGARMEVAAALAAQGVTAYDKAMLFKQVQSLAVVDELTGIANRRQFFEVAARDLAAAVRQGRKLAGLMLDIDHFKLVNDTYGHPTGDDVIRIVARRLAAQVRQTDLLGRYGGEEFAVLAQGGGPEDDLPERLRACIADTPVETRSGPLDISVSIGMTYLTPADTDVASLLARADEALYLAKHAGRNCIRTA